MTTILLVAGGALWILMGLFWAYYEGVKAGKIIAMAELDAAATVIAAGDRAWKTPPAF